MSKRFDEWEREISEYFKNNGLSVEKAKHLVQCSNADTLVLQYYDVNSKQNGEGLKDETPMPVVLWISRDNGEIKFEQTEFTHKYLSL